MSARALLLMCLALGNLLAWNSCGGIAPMEDEQVWVGPPAPAPALDRIADEAAWAQLRALPEVEAIARVEEVKGIVELDGWRVHFLDSNRFPLHYSYARDVLGDRRQHQAFNIQEYRRQDRRYVLFSIQHFLDADAWIFEQAASDILDTTRLAKAFERVRALTFFGDRLRYRPSSPAQEAHLQSARLPAADLSALLAHVQYQPLVLGTAFGYLRFVEGELDPAEVSPRDILVLTHTPDELPPCAALITETLQAPLAHVAVLSRNRGTPDMALRGASTQRSLRALEGQLVQLVVSPQDFSIQVATAEEADAAWAARRPHALTLQAPDLSTETLTDTCALHASDARFAGAKAAQLGAVCQLSIATPGGFVLPFAHYQSHIYRNHLGNAIHDLLANRSEETAQRADALQAIRDAIEAAPLARGLAEAIRARMAEDASARDARWIFRSSTNAEDLPGFNGAGLYRSIVVPPRASAEEIARAIKEVWASVWLQRAFEERGWYQIDHSLVAMAILIQPFVAQIEANGVALTRNPFDEGRPAVYINAQLSEAMVTAGGPALPEQALVYTWAESYEPEIIARSTAAGGRAILSEPDLLSLTEILMRLHDHLTPTYPSPANAVDVEFMLTGGPERFVIVQARPIEVRYEEGQRWRTP